MISNANSNDEIRERCNFFSKRTREEFYDFEKDPDALVNLINEPEYQNLIKEFREDLKAKMEKYKDPLLDKYHTLAYDERIEEYKNKFFKKMKTVGNEAINYRNIKNPWKEK